ncbi:MAG TPA: GLUG motif-containing protein [Candidatus Cloacimonadota bacterium]|nr:GLUG motif-containing protein [Candidatus Cloacimonadota bacterium]
MKRLMFVLGLFLLAFSLLAQTAVTPVGEGTEAIPYQIATWQNLYWISQNSSAWDKHFIQTADIDFADANPAINTWNDSTGWSPIGNDSTRFTGKYNGNNKTITGLFINRPNAYYQGFWGLTNSGSEIKNLGLISVNVTGRRNTGSLAGLNDFGSIINCYSTGNVSGNYTANGGLVGYNSQGNINNSYSSANVNSPYYSGGLVGINSDGIITSCYSTGNVSALRHCAGGITGANMGGTVSNSYSTGTINSELIAGGLVGLNSEGAISNCYSTGSVSGNNNTGGLTGSNYDGTISDSYSTGNVSGEYATGGLVGINSHGTIMNSFSTGDIEGIDHIGGLVGDGSFNLLINSYYNYENVLINNTHTITTGALTNDLYNAWFPNKSLNISDYLTSDSSNYFINSVTDLKTILAFGQFPEYHFKLTNHLDLVNENDFYIPYFSGTFNGNGYTISNLTINKPDIHNIAMFGYVDNAHISNLGLININVNGDDHVGGLAGLNNKSHITNCFSTGNVSGVKDAIGGLTGFSELGTVSNSFSTVNVNGRMEVGGLTGYFYNDSISNSYSSGSVNGSVIIGGFVGRSQLGTIRNSYSTGSVIYQNYGGGFAGNSNQCEILNSFWDIESSGQTTSNGGIGKTTAEMKTLSTFTDAGWTFPNPWNMNPDINQGYPYLNYEAILDNDELVIDTPHKQTAFLHAAYPNPFNPSSTISFDLTSPETVKIDIYNVKGQLVKHITNQFYHTGKHSIIWDGKDSEGNNCGTGVYFYKMFAGKTIQTRKMMMIK